MAKHTWGAARTPAGWARSGEQVLIADLSACTPKRALSPVRRRGRWKLIPYESEGFSGTCVAAGPLSEAPPLCIDPGLTGWHAIYLGLAWQYGEQNVARVRLSSWPACRRRSHRAAQNQIEEVFLCCADLSGEKVHIAQQSAGTPRACVVMFLRFVPLIDAEIEEIRAEREDRESKRLVATIDGHSYLCERRPVSREEILEELTDFADSDFGMIWYGGVDSGLASGDPPEILDFAGVPYRNHYEAVHELRKRGIDVNRTVVEAAHRDGLKVHMSLRPGSFAHPIPFEEYDSPLYADHPEWRCVDRDGTPALRVSFAVPEVRAHVVELFRRSLESRPDGINILFNRGCSVILWEPAFCELFRDRYGGDARELDDDDRRIRELRAEIMTGFMRELRQLLDETRVAQQRSEPLELSAMVLGTEELNRRWGLDVEAWAREGLVDSIGVSWAAFDAYSHVDGTPRYELEYFRRISEETALKVYPNLNPIEWESMGDPEARFRQWHVGDVRLRSLERYGGGADGLAFWDVSAAREDGRLWPVIRRLGHREELASLAAAPAPERITYPIRRWGDVVYTCRFNPWAGG